MLTVLFMITSVALNNTPYCPHWYLMTSVILSPRAETAARAENTGCVLETPFVRQPVNMGLEALPRAPSSGHTLCVHSAHSTSDFAYITLAALPSSPHIGELLAALASTAPRPSPAIHTYCTQVSLQF